MLNVFTFQFLNIVVTSVQNPHANLQEFYEHFKYDVISSSLLSSSIIAPSSTRRRSSPSPDDPPSDDPEPNITTLHLPPPPSAPVIHRSRALALLLFLCPITLYLDYFMLYVLIGTVLYYFGSNTIASGRLPDFIPPVGASYFYPTLCLRKPPRLLTRFRTSSLQHTYGILPFTRPSTFSNSKRACT